MCLSSITLETLGLLLRVWLWISVPMAVIILFIATYMNYLQNARPKGGLNLAVEGLGGEVSPGNGDIYMRTDDVAGEEAGGEEELTATGKETIYRGILWMKEKYEQYREQTDRQLAALRVQLDLKQGIINELEAQLCLERIRVEKLAAKLQDKSINDGQNIPDLGK
jgi:hypothetical protein